MRRAIALLALLLGGNVLAQESTNFKLSEHAFNSGGTPQGGAVLTSTSFHLTLSAIGQGVTPVGLSSTNFNMGGGFVGTYPPPGEVTNLRFTNPTTLNWDGEPSVGVYHLYEGTFSDTVPFDPGYGTCLPPDIASPTTMFTGTPDVGQALFVLLTAENRIAEEGTKGFNSAGAGRPNPAPCP